MNENSWIVLGLTLVLLGVIFSVPKVKLREVSSF
jgi:cbb3-type cytochrome oxidase subunit 3